MWARRLTAKQARREVAPLIEHLGLQPQPPFAAPAPFVAHAGEYKGLQITVVTSGKDAATGVNATVSTLQQLRNLGIAGCRQRPPPQPHTLHNAAE